MLLLVTPGDPAGIGPEITWKAFHSKEVKKLREQGVLLAAVGSAEALELAGAHIEIVTPPKEDRSLEPLIKKIFKQQPDALPVFASPTQINLSKNPYSKKQVSHLGGYQSGWSIETAVRWIQKFPNKRALVTGPISKENFMKAGFPFPGHTEFLGHLNHSLKNAPPIMMLANQKLRIVLATVHVSIQNVSKQITQVGLKYVIQETSEFLKTRFKIKRPRIAVLGLNPHCGENGHFGKEEIHTIRPVLSSFNDKSTQVFGPFPADTFFATELSLRKDFQFDAVVAMYHDQGLIPVKMIDFDRTVNVTLGVDFIRTSVDHGTGFNIAGKGIANPSSMISAIQMAATFLGKK